jgi:hypothetical protein
LHQNLTVFYIFSLFLWKYSSKSFTPALFGPAIYTLDSGLNLFEPLELTKELRCIMDLSQAIFSSVAAMLSMARMEAQLWCLAGAKGLAFLSIREVG